MSGWHYGVKENGCTAAEQGGEPRCRLQLWASWGSSVASNTAGTGELQFAPIWNDLIEISIEGPRHRGVKTQKKKRKKKHRAQSITAFWSHDQHLSFTVNVAWNTWAGTGGAISAGSGGGAVERCCWQVRWKSDDKYSQSDSYFGFCQFGGAEQRLSSLVHCVLMRTCLPDPSFHLSCDHSILLLRDVSQRLCQNNPITLSMQFFLCFFFSFPCLIAESAS